MGTKISIMNLTIDLISIETLIDKITEYLTNDYLNIVFLVSSKNVEIASENEEFRNIMQSADLIIPGEELLLSMHHVEVLETGGMVVNYKFLNRMFDSFKNEKKTFFVVGRDERETKLYIDYVEQTYDNLKASDYYYGDLEQNTELLINKINSITPDILLFAINSPLQEEWIYENSSKLNSKLCIGIGQVIDSILKDYKQPPKILQLLKLERIYRFLTQERKFRKIRETRIFKKKFAHYKSKKDDNVNGENK